MSLFTIADLHLSSDGKKSMEAFGNGWQNYMERIQANWCRLVKESDTVVIPGDISWALKLEDTVSDFKFLNSLPGKKLLGKGNHDFWWSTASKMKAFFLEHHFDSFELLYNNAFLVDNKIICGSRGWFTEESQQKTVGTVDYNKIIQRELIRLRMSLTEGKKIQEETGFPILVFLHFPPVWGDFHSPEILNLLQEFQIQDVYFGHIHGSVAVDTFQQNGMKFHLISADALHFIPQFII